VDEDQSEFPSCQCMSKHTTYINIIPSSHSLAFQSFPCSYSKISSYVTTNITVEFPISMATIEEFETKRIYPFQNFKPENSHRRVSPEILLPFPFPITGSSSVHHPSVNPQVSQFFFF
jgi:hypothetical protein